MTKKIFFCLVLVVLITGNVYSYVSSKVKGKIIDEITKQSIPGAVVKMIISRRHDATTRFLDWKTVSDERGEFSFDVPEMIASMNSRNYYIEVEKDGYMRYPPDYYHKFVKSEYKAKVFGFFSVREGEIKYFVNKLKKGGTIRGVLKKKIGETITPMKVSGLIRTESKLHDFFREIELYTLFDFEVDKNGIFEIKNLEQANDYVIVFLPKNYVSKEIKNISVKENEVTNVEYIFNQSNRTGIKGVVTWKNGPVDEEAGIEMIKLDTSMKYGKAFMSEKNGKFEYKGILPGRYKLIVSYYELKDNLPFVYKKKFLLRVLPDKVTNININFD